MIPENENLSTMSEETDEEPAKIPLEGLIRYLNKKLKKKEACIRELENKLSETNKDNVTKAFSNPYDRIRNVL